jgi:N-formylglutamate amidohydrolase
MKVYTSKNQCTTNNHYLVHLPHCGTYIPTKYIEDYFLSKDELNDNIYQYADLYTDDLFDSIYQEFGGVKNDYSRLLFDPERFFDDEKEFMHQKFKLGWFYENAILQNKPLRTTKNKEEISKYFKQHHKELSEKTKAKLDMYGKCTIIDCHSFSDEIYWFLNNNIELPDICIGYEDIHKDQQLVDIILQEFKGFKVVINKPYSGSLVPIEYYKKDFRVKSVMIEINKKLYLESDNTTKSKGYCIIKQKINNILDSM